MDRQSRLLNFPDPIANQILTAHRRKQACLLNPTDIFPIYFLSCPQLSCYCRYLGKYPLNASHHFPHNSGFASPGGVRPCDAHLASLIPDPLAQGAARSGRASAYHYQRRDDSDTRRVVGTAGVGGVIGGSVPARASVSQVLRTNIPRACRPGSAP
jgi:hypothetical protein